MSLYRTLHADLKEKTPRTPEPRGLLPSGGVASAWNWCFCDAIYPQRRQCVKVDKDSGIVNDANDYAIETMNNPAYPLELFQRVITVSLETMKIVKSLPPLDLD